MSIRHILAIAAIFLGGFFAYAQPGAWVDRAGAMLAIDNAVGAIDQSAYALQLPLSASEAERADFIEATAMVRTNPDRAKAMLADFFDKHPHTSLLSEVTMALGDCYYRPDGSWRTAYDYYKVIDPASLPQSKAELLAYRSAYCLLQLGNTRQAAALLRTIAGSGKYGEAARFFLAYALYAQGDYAAALPAMEQARSPRQPGDMADFYLAQMYYLKADYHRALACANLMLEKADVPVDFRAEARRVAGECQYRLGNRAQARALLRKYADAVAEPLPSALYILGLFEYEDGNYGRAVDLLTPASEGGDAMAQSAYLYIGQARLAEGDYDGAAMALNRALGMDFDPQVQEAAYYNYAVASLKGGKVPFGNAVSIFQGFLGKYPDSPRAPQVQQYIIDEYFKRHDYSGALAGIKAMVKPTRETSMAAQRALYMYGAQLLANADVAAAIANLEQAAAMKGMDSEVARQSLLLLGEAYYADAQFSKAAAVLKKYVDSASAADSNLHLALFDLGYAYVALGQFEKADATLRRYVDMADRSADRRILADAYMRLGDSNYVLRRYDRAASDYDRAMELNPSAGDYALMQKALMQGYQRKYRQKIELLESLRDSYPASPLMPRALLETAQSRIQLGDNAGATEAYRILVKRYPASSQAREGLLQMALSLANSGNVADAKDAYKAVVTSYPQSDEAAQAIEALKRLSAADGTVADLRAFLSAAGSGRGFDASEADALTFEAAEQEYLASGNYATLKRYLQEYPEGVSRNQALAYLAEAAQAEEDAEKGNLALQSWRFIMDMAPEADVLAKAWMGVARCGVQAGDYAAAAEGAALAADAPSLSRDTQAEAAYIYGVCLSKQGHAQGAAEQWREAAKHPSAYHGMAAAVALAQQALDAGSLDSAEQLAREAADADTPHSYWVARAFIVLSDVYAAKGDSFKAKQYIKSLRDNYPGSEPDIISDINRRLK